MTIGFFIGLLLFLLIVFFLDFLLERKEKLAENE